MPKIFISYRRDDSIDIASRIHGELARHFGSDEVFFDIHTMRAATHFPKKIEESLHQCQLLLAIIGPDWIGARREDGTRRLDDPDDFVRIELETALRLRKYVVPVLVREARCPRKEELPESLQELVSWHASRVRSDHDFHANMDRLIRDLEREIGPAVRSDTQLVSRPIRVVPQGLHSFGKEDAGFFLDLLPGPVDQEGLPPSIRFWKTRIEELDADMTFRVGIIHGPSGCGKSSLVKAGLLPRLSDSILASYVEATSTGTESQLLRTLRKNHPAAAAECSLSAFCAQTAHGESARDGVKQLIVLDQFEQWLHVRGAEREAELIEALRHCDGTHLQCLLLVRDDFWSAINRFMRMLDIEMQEGSTCWRATGPSPSIG